MTLRLELIIIFQHNSGPKYTVSATEILITSRKFTYENPDFDRFQKYLCENEDPEVESTALDVFWLTDIFLSMSPESRAGLGLRGASR